MFSCMGVTPIEVEDLHLVSFLCGLPGSTNAKQDFIAGEGHSIVLPQHSLIINANLDTKRSLRFETLQSLRYNTQWSVGSRWQLLQPS